MSRKQLRMLMMVGMMILLWQLLAMYLQNDVLLPYPVDVLHKMHMQIRDPIFYTSVCQTLLRIIIGFLIALIMALLSAFLANFYPWFADLFYPLLHMMRSIPNISYILMVLFWFSAQSSVMIISFLILFPTIYVTLYQGLCDIPKDYHDIMAMSPGSKRFDIIHVYLPFLRPYILSATSAGLSLALKVGIMAEILGQVKVGIGRQLNICRLNLDMAGVFAWTIWIMILLFGMERCLALLRQFFTKHH